MQKRLRVLLVYPKRDPESQVRTQFSQEKVHGLLTWPFRVRSYGLAFNGLETLASLTPDWCDVKLVNENIDDIDFNADVDLVALTVMVTNATRACQIGDKFRDRGVKVVMGGYYPYMVPDHALLHADAVCISEADTLWTKMLEDVRDGKLEKIYEQTEKTDMKTMVHRSKADPKRWLRNLTLTIQASRGCPFDCEFCSIVHMLGHTMRYKTPENIIEELEHIYKHDWLGRVAGRHIFFVDDNIFGQPKEFKAICRAIISLNKRYPNFTALFGSQLTINVSKDKEALQLMREAGFYNIFIGLESTSVDVLRSYNKLHNIAFNYDEAIARIREHGMEVIASFIFGTDADTPECFEAAFDFFDRNNILYPYFNILTPIGNQWKRYLKEGRLMTVKPRLYDAHHTVFVPMKMKPIDLQTGFIKLVDRTFSYDNIAKRLLATAGTDSAKRLLMSPISQKLMYWKIAATLRLQGDTEGLAFLHKLKPQIDAGNLSMVSVLIQLDQHDFAVQNRLTLAEHRYKLDVPCWEDRPQEQRESRANSAVTEALAAAVR